MHYRDIMKKTSCGDFWRRLYLCAMGICAVLFASCAAAQVQVRHAEGLLHGFLVLRTMEGETIANGDLIQNVSGDKVTSELVFHFKDGSLHDDKVVYTQRRSFRFVSEHLVQKGPSFERAIEMTVDGNTGMATVHYNEKGEDKTETEHLKLPPDVGNGMQLVLLKNILPSTPETKIGFVAATPKPRLVTLVITPQGEETFTTGEEKRKAMHYLVKIDIGGITGAFADLLGKRPPDTNVWILEGEAPAFVKSEGPLAMGGPVWRIELVSPVWPRSDRKSDK